MSAAPFDPFQVHQPSGNELVQQLGARWMELTRQLDDPALALPDGHADDARRERAWNDRRPVEARIMAIAEPSIGGIVLKLRIAAWWMNVANAECANCDGVRTNPLDHDEAIVVQALAEAERLAGSATS